MAKSSNPMPISQIGHYHRAILMIETLLAAGRVKDARNCCHIVMSLEEAEAHAELEKINW